MRQLSLIVALLCLAGQVSAQSTAPPRQNPFQGIFAKLHLPTPGFDETPPPPAPDYSRAASWAALPGTANATNAAPVGETVIDPASAQADVFFIHPTTLLSSDHWNQSLDDQKTNSWTDAGPMHSQASAFNGCCRIYAPRYRQAGLSAQTIFSADSVKAQTLAYDDVKRAFRYYLDHYNNGRPYIIASHSQGTRHAINLLPEMVDGQPAMARFVAGYLIGAWIPESWFAGMKAVKPCNTATDTVCVVGWATLAEGSDGMAQRAGFGRRDGREANFAAQSFLCVNPLRWSRTTEPASAALNLGGWTRAGSTAPRLADPGLVGARCDTGALFIGTPSAPGYQNAVLPGGNYHNYDYGLFYMNIRRNAVDRINSNAATRR